MVSSKKPSSSSICNTMMNGLSTYQTSNLHEKQRQININQPCKYEDYAVSKISNYAKSTFRPRKSQKQDLPFCSIKINGISFELNKKTILSYYVSLRSTAYSVQQQSNRKTSRYDPKIEGLHLF